MRTYADRKKKRRKREFWEMTPAQMKTPTQPDKGGDKQATASKTSLMKSRKPPRQAVLNFGQTLKHEKLCAICNMPCFSGDEKEHEKRCVGPDGFVHWASCKDQRGVRRLDELEDGLVVLMVDPSEELSSGAKLRYAAIERVVAVDLGFFSTERDDTGFTLLCVSPSGGLKNRVVAYVSVVRLKTAHRLLADGAGFVRESPASPAVLGFHKVWVHRDFRRRGIASRLLEIAVSRAGYLETVPRGACAFSHPTGEGALLAERFFGRKDYLVY